MAPLRIAFTVFLALHGLIHLLGSAKAFGWSDVSQLRSPISATMGLLWLLTAVLFVAGAISFALRAPWWWYVTLPAVVLSQWLIVTVWSDARFGTIANAIILIPVIVAALDGRASSFSSRFARDRAVLLARATPLASLVSEADLIPLPPLMQQYLRVMGVVGHPRVHNVRVVFKAQMRSSANSPWMQSTAVQYEFFHSPARLFHMNASRAGIPFDVFHRYVDGTATFQVRIAGLKTMVDKRGAGLTNDETVTLMNDVLVLAPAAVLDLPFTFESTGAHTLRATFQNAGYTVSAMLKFNAAGDLTGFQSADRAHDHDGGAAIWSTPISGYREVDGIRIGTLGDANWIDSSGEWTYGKFEIVSIAYNVER
ncbi:MAG: DUF6544 family protein [Gemmatimonadaceae bacterium]